MGTAQPRHERDLSLQALEMAGQWQPGARWGGGVVRALDVNVVRSDRLAVA